MITRVHALVPNALREGDRRVLVDGVVHSEYIGESVLGPEFVGTEGFSLVFRRSNLETVLRRLPYLQPLLNRILFEDCNGFYLNVLVLYEGSRVDAHIDCRLLPGSIRLVPNLVSVYYAQVPAALHGGALVFNPSSPQQFKVSPRTGELVHFLGGTVHLVEPITGAGQRISVVCEQYNLDDITLHAFPQCEVLASGSLLTRVNGLAGFSEGANTETPS